MKTILIVFCVACCLTLQAQPPLPPTNLPPADPAAIERAREAVRATIAGNTNGSNPVSIFPGAGAPIIVNTPGATNTPVIVNLPPSGTAPVVINANGASNVTVNSSAVRTNRQRPAFPAFPTSNPNRLGNGATNAAAPDAVLLTPPPAPTMVPSFAFKPAAPEPADVDINFPAVALPEVLEFYAQLVKRTILQATLPQITINLKTYEPLTRSEAIQALDSVLAMNNITMIPIGDKFVKAVQSADAGKQALPFSTNDEAQLPEADQYVTRIVQLKYVKTADVMAAIQPLSQIASSVIPLDANNMIIIRDYAANVKRMLEIIKQIDVIVPLDFEQEVIPILYGKAEDIASALSSLGAGGGGTTVGTRPTTGARPLTPGMGGSGYGANGMGTTPGISNPGGVGGAGAPRNKNFSQRGGNINKKAAGQGDFQVFGQTKIIADTRTNSLLVFASKQDMEMIKQIIKKLDIVLPQVLIEAIIMEVTLDKGVTTGVSYLQNNVSTPGNYFSGIGAIQNGSYLNPGSFVNTGTNLASLPSGLSYFANFGGDFQATLTAVANDSRINVLSEPRIQTSHGVPASLQVGETVPEVTGTYFGGINGQASSQYQQTFVGIDLEVTPLINPDGLVVMDIMQDVEQLGNPTTIDGNPVPTTSKRTASATVSVRDRETIILGGMISNSKTTTRSGVPLLKDIPGLGYLFRSTADTSERVELIVLIHPTVLPTPALAALEATHEREKLPGIKAAEAENRREEIRRMKEAEKIHVPRENE